MEGSIASRVDGSSWGDDGERALGTAERLRQGRGQGLCEGGIVVEVPSKAEEEAEEGE